MALSSSLVQLIYKGKKSHLTSEQRAGFRGSERIIAGGDPHQQRVLGGILETEVPELSRGLGHL